MSGTPSTGMGTLTDTLTGTLTGTVSGIDRRAFLAAGGGLLVSFGAAVHGQNAPRERAACGAEAGEDAGPRTGSNGLPANRLDAWLAIDAQGRVTASVGKIDAGLGIPTALAQIVADELDVAFSAVTIRMGDTATTVDQRGTGSSNGVADGGQAMRIAGAQARAFSVARAAQRLALPVEALTVQDGVVRAVADPSRRVSYGELLQGGRFELPLDTQAQPKPASQYRWVGRPVQRVDIPPKVTGRYEWLVDLKLPGMVHARVLRPPTAGARLLGVEALPGTPGFMRLVQQGNFVAVVAEREEQAIAAAARTRLNWSEPTLRFPRDGQALYEMLRTAPATGRKGDRSNGDVDAALAAAARTLEAQYEYPFQSHACMGPACALAQVSPEGVTVWMGARPSGTQRFSDSLASQLVGGHVTRSEDLCQISAESYRFEHKRVSGELVDWRSSLSTGLRTAHLRDPDGIATCFASESFIDELATAAGQDPVAFRLKHLAEPRHAAVVRAAAERAGWQPRVRHNPAATSGGMRRGRGIAYAPRNGAVVAIVAEVEVNPASGQWRATRFVVAHDCGMVINPLSLEGVIESNILMSLSRARFEEVRFDETRVLSTDWASYSILDIQAIPDRIDVVLVGNESGRSYGAGEPSTRPVAAALANALFDATGTRLRRVPFTPERLLAARRAA